MIIVFKYLLISLITLCVIVFYPSKSYAVIEQININENLKRVYEFMLIDPFLVTIIIFVIGFLLVSFYFYKKLKSVDRFIEDFYSIDEEDNKINPDENEYTDKQEK